MELREWLIILGLALVTLIVIDGFRRLQRQRRVPRLDQVGIDARDTRDRSRLDPGVGPEADPEEVARQAEINWELPNGGARVVSPADFSSLQAKPKLERQDHPGPSSVLSAWKASVQPEEPGIDEDKEGTRHAAVTKREGGHGRKGVGLDIPAHSKAVPSRDLASEASKQEADSPSRRHVSAHSAQQQTRQTRKDSVNPRVDTKLDDSETLRGEAMQASLEKAAPDSSSHPSPAPAQADSAPERREPRLSTLDDTPTVADPEPLRASEPLAADPGDHDDFQDEDRYRLVDLDGMGDSLKSGSRRVGDSVQRFGASLQKTLAERRDNRRLEKRRRDQEKAEKAAMASAQRQREEAEKASREAERRRLESESRIPSPHADRVDTASVIDDSVDDAWGDGLDAEIAARDVASPDSSRHADPHNDVVRTHPVLEKALRHDVSAEHARHALSHSEEIIVISIMSRDEEGFSGTALLDLMLACGLRYSRDMGIFHRFETEDPESRLQFSMVNALKPGIFPIEAMDDFRTPGVTLLMPLPGAIDTAAAFEAMVETAMVIVRNLGGELKDENLSVMTAQTVGFARQRVQEFERRNRLNRYQVN